MSYVALAFNSNFQNSDPSLNEKVRGFSELAKKLKINKPYKYAAMPHIEFIAINKETCLSLSSMS